MGGCMSKLKPQGPSLNVYFKIAICRFLISDPSHAFFFFHVAIWN